MVNGLTACVKAQSTNIKNLTTITFMRSRFEFLSSYQINATLVYCVQIFIVLLGTTLGLRSLGLDELIIPVTLGAIATALTDFDDRLTIRLRNLMYVSVLFLWSVPYLSYWRPIPLFYCVPVVIEWLFNFAGFTWSTLCDHFIWYCAAVCLYPFGLGEYTHWYQQPLYFVYGVLWYGLTSVLFYMIKPTLAVQDNLAQIFQNLSQVLTLKSRLFDPDNLDNVEQLLFELSLENSKTVQSLNSAKVHYSAV